MTTGLQLALAGGALVGLGVALLLWRLAPAHPDLADALQRLSPEQARRGVDPLRCGRWPAAARRVGVEEAAGRGLGPHPHPGFGVAADPAGPVLRREGVVRGGGLCIPPLLSALFYLLDLRLPVVIPVVATMALATVMFWLPDVNVRDDAKKARAEFARALGAYIDLVALERHSGSGTGRPWRWPPTSATAGCFGAG